MISKNNRLATLLSLSQKAFGGYKKQIVTLVLLGFLGGILEGIGVNALIPLFSFILDDAQAATDPISQAIQEFFSFINIDFNIYYILVFIVLMFIGKSVIKIYLDYLKIKITAHYEIETRKFVFHKILKTSWEHLIKQKLGHLENIILIDVPYGASVLKEISASTMILVNLAVYLLIAVNINLVITLITLVIGLIVFLILKPLNFKTKKLAHETVKFNKEISHFVGESVLGVKTIKSLWMTRKVEQRAEALFLSLHNVRIKVFFLRSVIGSSIQPVAVIFVAVILAFVYQTQFFSLPALIAIVYLIQKVFSYIQQLQKSFNIINERLPHLRSVIDYREKAISNEERQSGAREFSFKKSLFFDNVSFQYAGKKQREVLNNITFEVNNGEMLGVIGPSGAGKTTLVDIMLRLLHPTTGSINLDGVLLDEISLQSWRENIGYVSQDMFLINDTIANNIRFYDDSVSEEQIVRAARMANIYDFIKGLPDGFETSIGERGMQISAGQRQRIVIARVLARQPKVLILDEATSALDTESENQVQKVIEALHGQITVIAIAHRLSTVMNSDRLIVLEGGRVKEIGKPSELLDTKDSYFSRAYNLRT